MVTPPEPQHLSLTSPAAPWESLLLNVALRIRSSLELGEILQTTVAEVQHLLQADRVLIYRFEPDWSGQVIVEAASQPDWSILNQVVQDECFDPRWLSPYQQRQSRAIADVAQAGLSDCYREFLAQFQVKAVLVVPIYVREQLWGLTVIHHCSSPRAWLPQEVDFLEQLSVQSAIAIQQALLLQEVQQTKQTLEARVAERTAELERQLAERQQVETALKATEDRLAGILDVAEDAIISVDHHQCILLFNQGAVKIFGYSAEEALGQPLGLLLPERFMAAHHQHVQAFSQSPTQARRMGDRRAEIIARRKDGREFPAEASISKLVTPNGQVILTVILRDISDRIESRLALTESERRYRQIVETAQEGIWMIDLEGLTTFVNPRMAQMLGYTVETMLGRPFFDFMEPADRAIAIEKLQQRRRGYSEQHEFKFRCHDESILWAWLAANPILDANGQPTGALAMVTDITQHKQTEAALRQSEATKQALIDSIPDLLIRMRRDGLQVKVINPSALHLIQPQGGSEGRNVLDCIPPEAAQERLQLTAQALDTWQIQSSECQFVINGQVRHEESRIVPINDEEVLVVVRDITERKAAEATLRQQKELLQMIFDHLPVMITSYNQAGRMLLINRESERALGWALSDYHQGDVLAESYPDPAYRQQVLDHMMLADGRWQDFRTLTRRGTSLETTWANIRLSDGRFLGIGQDISDRKQAEDSLRQSEEKFRQLAENIHQVFFILSHTGETLYISPAYEQIWGRSRAPLYENSLIWLRAVHPEDRPRVEAALQVKRAGNPFDETYRIIRPDGEVRWIKARSFPIQDDQGQVYRFAGIAEDITARKQAQETLQRQLREALLLKQITDRIRHSLDPEEVFQTAAQQIGQVFGVDRCLIYTYQPEPPDESETEPRTQITLEAEYLAGNIASVAAVVWSMNDCVIQVLSQESAIAMDEMTSQPIEPDIQHLYEQMQVQSLLAVGTFYQGQPNGMIGLHQCDRLRHWAPEERSLIEAVAAQLGIAIAQARLLEREKLRLRQLRLKNDALKQAKQAADDANRAKSEFLANMSHEIRTPMNAVLGFTELLQDLITDPLAKTYLDTITSSGETLLALINDILDLSKIEAGKLQLHFEPVDLRHLVQEIQQIFVQKALERNLHLYVSLDSSLPQSLRFDPVRLRQILFNVVGNALKFTESGQVKIEVDCTPAPEPEHGVQLRIAVMDTGIGIAPDHQEKIFEAFTQSDGQITRKYGGTGLGLTITQRLVQMLGGTITLSSELGRGTTFVLSFPQVAIAGSPAPKPLALSDPNDAFLAGPALKILIADDTPSNLELVAGYLAQSPHELLFAADGQTAIAIAQTQQPNVILLDLKMPILDGRATAQRLKQDPLTCTIPIFLLTASPQAQSDPELQHLCQGFLSKPLNRTQLLSALRSLVSPLLTAPAPSPEASNPLPLLPGCSDNSPWEITHLRLDLQQQADPLWQRLCKTLAIRDLEQFIEILRALGQTYHCPLVLDYTARLQTQLDQFDWEHLPKTVEQFSAIQASLKACEDSQP